MTRRATDAPRAALVPTEPTARRGRRRFVTTSVLPALWVLVSLACASPGPPQAADPVAPRASRPLSVLFVGNSLTFVNEVPGLTRSLAAAAPHPARLAVRSVTRGGATLESHWRSGDAARALREQRPDVLILQGQSAEPLVAEAAFARHAQLLKAEADSVGARTILFQTWARPVGDPFYSNPVSGGSPAAMQARLNRAYDSLARRLGVEVARVGEAFALARREAPEVRLLDGSQHATLAGSYLAAAVLFKAICNASPRGATFTAGLPGTTAGALQHAADAGEPGRP